MNEIRKDKQQITCLFPTLRPEKLATSIPGIGLPIWTLLEYGRKFTLTLSMKSSSTTFGSEHEALPKKKQWLTSQ